MPYETGCPELDNYNQATSLVMHIGNVDMAEYRTVEAPQARWIECLKVALENATDASISVKVDMSGERQNEIDVMSVAYCFPFRCLQNLAFYRDKYNYLTTVTPSMSEAEVRKYKVILYGEGSGGEGLPDLFIAAERQKSQLRQEYMPYVMMACAMDLIKYADTNDGTGRKAYGTISVDELLGLETLRPIAPKFTEIGSSEAFTETFCEDLQAQVENLLKTKYLNVVARSEELVPKVQKLLAGVILPETGGNTGAPEFLQYADAARTAITILKK